MEKWYDWDMKKLIQFKLKFLAKAILSKYKLEIIGITGSVGKTGAKEAVYAVFSYKFNARRICLIKSSQKMRI